VPIKPPVDIDGFRVWKIAHCTGVAIGPRYRLGDAKARRAAPVSGVGDIAAFTFNEPVDQVLDLDYIVHNVSRESQYITKRVCCRKALRTDDMILDACETPFGGAVSNLMRRRVLWLRGKCIYCMAEGERDWQG
jgi:hypothetical protein